MGKVTAMNRVTLAVVMPGPERPDEDTCDGFA